MITSRRSRVRLCIAMAAGLSGSIVEVKLAPAQQITSDPTVFLNASDTSGNSSFFGGPNFNWSASSDSSLPAGSAPITGYAYVDTGSAAGTGKLLTPATGSATFGGDSLTVIPYNGQPNLTTASTTITNALDTSAALMISGNISGQSITVNNLVLGNGGAVVNAGPTPYNNTGLIVSTLNGNVTLVPAGTTLDGVTTTVSGGIVDATSSNVTNSANLLVVNSTLTGSGSLHVVSTGGTNFSAVALNASSPSFSGGVVLDNLAGGGSNQAPDLLIDSPYALGTGTLTINSNVTGSSGGGPVIDNATGSPLTVATNNPMVWNGGFQYDKNVQIVGGNNSLNLGAGGVTLGGNLTITLYGTGVLSETGGINGSSYTLYLSSVGYFEVPSPSNFHIHQTNVSNGATLGFLATNTSSAQFISALSSSAINFSSGTSLGIDTTGYSGTFVLSGTLPSTAIGIAKLGTGTMQLALTAPYTGPTNISAGTLQIGNTTSLTNSSSGVVLQPGAVLDLNGFPTSVSYLNGSGGTVTNNGSSPAILSIITGSSSNSATATAIYAGNFSNGTSTLGLTVNLSTGTYNFNASGAAGSYSGGTLLKSGTLIVGANTIPNNSNIAFNGGSLDFAAQPANGFTMNVGSGSSYNFNAGAGVTAFLSGNLSNGTSAASVNMSGTGVVILGGTNTYTGNTNIGSGTFGFASPASFPAAISASGFFSNNASGSFGFGNSVGTNFNLAIPISGTTGINKVGTDTVTLTGTSSTYTGTTNVSGGILQIGGPGVLPSASTVSVNALGTLDLNGFSYTLPNLAGTGVVTNSTTTPVALTIATGTTGVGVGWGGNISNGNATTSLVVNLASSSNSFNMSSSTNSYTGGTNLAAGTLVVGAISLPATGSVVFNGGSLDFTAPLTVDPSSNFVAGNGNKFNFNVGSSTAVVTLSGNLTDGPGGPASVVMQGAGILVLSGTNSYTGSTTINSGTLAFSSPASFPPSIAANGISVTGGAFGLGNNTSNVSVSIPISGAGGFTKIGTDTVTLAGNDSYQGTTTILNGTLALGSSTALGTGAVYFGSNSAAPNGILDLNGFSATVYSPYGGAYGGIITNSSTTPATLTLQNASSNSSYYGAITGNLSLVVNFPNPTASNPVTEVFGIGTVANPNTYNGTTTLQSGILEVVQASGLPTTSQAISFTGGILEMAAGSQTVASAMDYSSEFSQSANQQYYIAPANNSYFYTFATGLDSPGGSLTFGNSYISTGGGTLVLTAANTYSGPTVVNTGVLQLANSAAVADTSGITVNGSYGNPITLAPALFSTLQINNSSGVLGLTGATSGGAPITLNLSGLGANSVSVYYTTGVVTKTTHYQGYAFFGALQGTPGQTDTFAGNINLNGGGDPVGISGGFQNSSSGGILKLTGVISGTGPVVLGLNNGTTTVLANANTYSGETQITSAYGGATTVQLGANSAIPADSGLDFANCNILAVAQTPGTYGTATLDLNGFSTSTAYVTSSTSTITIYGSKSQSNSATGSNALITNTLNGSTATLTILGPASSPYLGVFQNGTGTAQLALNFDGGVQTITVNSGFTSNNYSGGTTVGAGILTVQGTSTATTLAAIGSTATGGGNLTINANAILQKTSSAVVFAKLAGGYNGGKWNGSGINSTAAASDTTYLTAVGMYTPASNTTFEGQPLNVGDVALKYTYYGDATLAGQVTGLDYTIIDNASLADSAYLATNPGSYSSQPYTGWQNGDFNYDGVINGSDYTLLDNAFNTQGAQFSSQVAGATAEIAGGTSAVPEPASLGLIGLTAAGLLGRRRRK